MSYVFLIAFGLILGFLSAIPIGAVQIEVVKRSVRGRTDEALALALGSGTSDLIYGTITLLGFGKLLFTKVSTLVLNALGIAVMAFLLVQTISDLRKSRKNGVSVDAGARPYPYITGFVIAITNPAIVAWWMIGFKVFLDMGFFASPSAGVRLLFVLSGCAGLVGYLVVLSAVLSRMGRDFSSKTYHRLNLGLAVLLAVMLAYFSARLLKGIGV